MRTTLILAALAALPALAQSDYEPSEPNCSRAREALTRANNISTHLEDSEDFKETDATKGLITEDIKIDLRFERARQAYAIMGAIDDENLELCRNSDAFIDLDYLSIRMVYAETKMMKSFKDRDNSDAKSAQSDFIDLLFKSRVGMQRHA